MIFNSSISSILESVRHSGACWGLLHCFWRVWKKEEHEGRIFLHSFVYSLRRSTRYRAASSPEIRDTDVNPGISVLGDLGVGAEVFTSAGVSTTLTGGVTGVTFGVAPGGAVGAAVAVTVGVGVA